MSSPRSSVVRTAALGFALALAACVTPPSTAPDAVPAGAYKLDPAHASLVWRIAHEEGLSRYTARFDRFDAALDFDPADPTAAHVEAVIDAASVSTGDPDFDDQIERVVLDAGSFPQIRFVSTSVEPTGPASARVTGDLSFHGATLPAALDVIYNGGARDPLRNADVVGFSATGAIDRTAFGADSYVNFGIGPTVELQIEAEFLKR